MNVFKPRGLLILLVVLLASSLEAQSIQPHSEVYIKFPGKDDFSRRHIYSEEQDRPFYWYDVNRDVDPLYIDVDNEGIPLVEVQFRVEYGPGGITADRESDEWKKYGIVMEDTYLKSYPISLSNFADEALPSRAYPYNDEYVLFHIRVRRRDFIRGGEASPWRYIMPIWIYDTSDIQPPKVFRLDQDSVAGNQDDELRHNGFILGHPSPDDRNLIFITAMEFCKSKGFSSWSGAPPKTENIGGATYTYYDKGRWQVSGGSPIYAIKEVTCTGNL